jgi:hypothetical protein
MPNTAEILFEQHVENFGTPIARLNEFDSMKGNPAVDLFWAPCKNWNEALLRNWLPFPVRYAGPFKGDSIPFVEKEKQPHEGGFLVVLPVAK